MRFLTRYHRKNERVEGLKRKESRASTMVTFCGFRNSTKYHDACPNRFHLTISIRYVKKLNVEEDAEGKSPSHKIRKEKKNWGEERVQLAGQTTGRPNSNADRRWPNLSEQLRRSPNTRVSAPDTYFRRRLDADCKSDLKVLAPSS
ncbi:hypothetical protein SDJN03_11957, partial [Cucurbita argyrosperma subsp. sororia]